MGLGCRFLISRHWSVGDKTQDSWIKVLGAGCRAEGKGEGLQR